MTEEEHETNAIGSAVELVVALIEARRIDETGIPAALKAAFDGIRQLRQPAEQPAPVPQEPAVSIRASVKPDAITCIECGIKAKMLKRHLLTAHDLTPDAYRAKWKLPAEYPMVAPLYSEQRKALALKIGLGKKQVPAKKRA